MSTLGFCSTLTRRSVGVPSISVLFLLAIAPAPFSPAPADHSHAPRPSRLHSHGVPAAAHGLPRRHGGQSAERGLLTSRLSSLA